MGLGGSVIKTYKKLIVILRIKKIYAKELNHSEDNLSFILWQTRVRVQLVHTAAGRISFSRPLRKSSGSPVGWLVAGFTKTWTEDPVVQAKASNCPSLGWPKKIPSLRSR